MSSTVISTATGFPLGPVLSLLSPGEVDIWSAMQLTAVRPYARERWKEGYRLEAGEGEGLA